MNPQNTPVNGGVAPSFTQAPAVPNKLTFPRIFTATQPWPFDGVTWKKVDAVIKKPDGTIVFEQKGVEAPIFWSDNAINIVAEKYFRVIDGVKEHSVKQLITRVASTITAQGLVQGLLSAESSDVFYRELTFLLVNQMFAFNSPVWFNIGVPGVPQQASACFINHVEDTMESITDLANTEVRLFKGGSGAGCNLSNIRSSYEKLSGGGSPSGPVSFMKMFDAGAGVTKSGGTTRRAAKMVVLDVDHPDILEQANGEAGFIKCKTEAEKVAQALIAAGFSSQFNKPGNAYDYAPFQNANNSVRVTDFFMQKVVDGQKFQTKARTTKDTVHTYEAKELWQEIAKAAWASGDPGIQFDTTTNDWHTLPNTGRINASNPCCFPGDTTVDTAEGRLTFDQLMERQDRLPLVFAYDKETRLPVLKKINKVWVAGQTKNLVEVRTDKGVVLRCTPEHRFLTYNDEYVEAQHLTAGTRLRKINRTINEQRSNRRSIETQSSLNDTIASVTPVVLPDAVAVYDMEVDTVHNFAVTDASSTHSIVVSNSEYLHLDNTSCNLGSFNLARFVHAGEFHDVTFEHAVRVCITAMEILVGYASYPTEEITKQTKASRPLGIGYANLGTLLMTQCKPYDSEGGREYAASITSLMSAVAYDQSAKMAGVVGAFDYYADNSKAMARVLGKHRDASARLLSTDISRRAHTLWGDCQKHAMANGPGFRNSQVSVLAPTGTIGFMMDCDTTGIEPMLALLQYKKLVGGGSIAIPNRHVEETLTAMGYQAQEIADCLTHVATTGELDEDIVSPEDLEVFQTAIGENQISVRGHLEMMAAVQPFLSGGISKTVNMPNSATVDDVAGAYLQAWSLGLKCVAIYRDGCKASQPASSKKEGKTLAEPESEELKNRLMATIKEYEAGAPNLKWGTRKRLQDERFSVTHKFSVGGQDGYFHVGLNADGTPGEVFINISKAGSTLHGLVDMAATAMSLGLQYGVPLYTLLEKFKGVRFEPAGFTGNPKIPRADSIADYLARWMEDRFIWTDEKLAVAKEKTDELVAHFGVTKTEAPKNGKSLHGDPCRSCGNLTVRAGSCYACPACGTTTGCG